MPQGGDRQDGSWSLSNSLALAHARLLAEQAEVYKKLTCKKSVKQRQLEAMEARAEGRTTWNGGEGGLSLEARKRWLAQEIAEKKAGS